MANSYSIERAPSGSPDDWEPIKFPFGIYNEVEAHRIVRALQPITRGSYRVLGGRGVVEFPEQR